MSELSDNKRSFSRLPSALGVTLDTKDGVRSSGHLRNLSMKGLLAECTTAPSVGDVVAVVVFVSDEAGIRVEAAGTVVRVALSDNGHLVAVDISELHELESYWTLRNWITYNAPEGLDVDSEFEHHLGIRPRTTGENT